jgi:hypothetical protein
MHLAACCSFNLIYIVGYLYNRQYLPGTSNPHSRLNFCSIFVFLGLTLLDVSVDEIITEERWSRTMFFDLITLVAQPAVRLSNHIIIL